MSDQNPTHQTTEIYTSEHPQAPTHAMTVRLLVPAR